MSQSQPFPSPRRTGTGASSYPPDLAAMSGCEGFVTILHAHHACHLRDVGREVVTRVGLATLGSVLHRVGGIMLATRRRLQHTS